MADTPARDWVIRKNGYFYRANRSGYTMEVCAAGRYTEQEARAEARVEPHSISAHPLSEFVTMGDTQERDQLVDEIAGYLMGRVNAPEPEIYKAAHGVIGLVGAEISRLRSELASHEAVHASHRKLVRELDVILNGEDGAAPQASLCDVVDQVQRLRSELERAREDLEALKDPNVVHVNMLRGGISKLSVNQFLHAAGLVNDWQLVPKRPTDEMALSAAEAHFGKRRTAESGGINGIGMTVDGYDYSFRDAFKRFWKGALASSPPVPEQKD